MAKDLIKIDRTGNTFLYKDNDGNLYGLQKWHIPHDTEPVELTHNGNPEDYDFKIPHDGFEAIAAEENLGLPIVVFKNVGPSSYWWYAKGIGDFYFQEFWYDWKTTGFGYEIKADETERIREHEIIFIHDFDGDGFIGDERTQTTKKLININSNEDINRRGNRSPEFTGLTSKNVNLLLEIRSKDGDLIASKSATSDANGFWTAQFTNPFENLDYLPDGEAFELLVHQQKSDLSEVKDTEPLDFLVDLKPPGPLSLSEIEGYSATNGSRNLKTSLIDHPILGVGLNVYEAKKGDTLTITGVSELLRQSFKTFDQSKDVDLKILVKDIKGEIISSQIIKDNVALNHQKENEWQIRSKIGEDEIYLLSLTHIDASGNESDPVEQYIYANAGQINSVKLSDDNRSEHPLAKDYSISNSLEPTFLIDTTTEARKILAFDKNGELIGESTTKNDSGNWVLKINTLSVDEYMQNQTHTLEFIAFDQYGIEIDRDVLDYTLDTRQEQSTSLSSLSNELDALDGKTRGERFGESVAISERGYRVAVSAPKRFIGEGQKKGAIDVFVAPFEKKLQQVGTSIINPNSTEDFGYAIKLAGDGHILFATTPSYSDLNSTNKGIVQVFQSTNKYDDNKTTWSLVQSIINQEQGILGHELRIDHKTSQLFISFGPNSKEITKEVAYKFDNSTGILSDPKTIMLDKKIKHDQINNQFDRQLGTSRNSLGTFGVSIAGNPSSSKSGYNQGAISYNQIKDLPATLLNKNSDEIQPNKGNQYTTNSDLITFTGQSPEFKSKISIRVEKADKSSEPLELSQIVDDHGNWRIEVPFEQEGEYRIHLLSQDLAGNPVHVKQIQSFKIDIDRKAPSFNKNKLKIESLHPSQSKLFIATEGKTSAKVGAYSLVELYYLSKSKKYKLSNVQAVGDDGIWKQNLSSTEDMLINKKKQGSYLLNVINMRSDLNPVISGEGEAGSKVEVFADHLNDPGLKKVGEVVVGDDGQWSLTTNLQTAGKYNFAFQMTDEAGNKSDLVKWMKQKNNGQDAITVTEETIKLLNPQLKPINDSSVINLELNQFTNDLPITINNKGSFKNGLIRTTFGGIPWKFAKIVTGSDKRTQGIKDIERAKQLFNITYTLGKKWLSTKENTDERLEFNIYTSFLTGSKAMGIVTDTLSDYQNARHATQIREFHNNFNRLALGSTATNYPVGLSPNDFSVNVKYNQLRKNQDLFTSFHRNQYNQSLEDESKARKMISKYKKILDRELKERQLSYDYPVGTTMSRVRNLNRIKSAEKNLKQAQSNLFKSVQQRRVYEWGHLDKQFELNLKEQAKSERLKAAKSGFKLANPALGIGSKAFYWNLSNKKNNQLFTAQQSVGISKDFTDFLDASIDIVQKTPFKKYIVDSQGNVTKKAKNVSSALTALGTGLSVAGSSLEIGNYANRIAEIEAIDCSKLFKLQTDIEKCRKDNQREIELLRGDIALRGTEAGLATMEGLVGVASTGVKAGTKMAKFLKVGGPLLGAAATAVSLFDNSQVLEFEKKRANINGIRKKIDTDFSAELLADGLTAQLAVQEGFNTAGKIVDGVTGVGSVIASVIPGGQPVALAAALLGGAITTALSFIEASRLEEEAMKIKDKMKTDSSGNKQTVEQFFEGSFLKQQQQLYDQINPQVDQLLSQKAYDEVLAINSQFLKDTDIELAGMTNSGGELGKSAKHFVGSRKKSGDRSWENNETSLDPRKGTINLREADKKNRYVSFFAPLNASGTERWEEVKEGKNKMLHKITIDDLKGWKIQDEGSTNSTFDLNDNIVTQAYKTKGDQEKNRLTKIDITILAGKGSDQYYANIASINFSGGGGYKSNFEKDYDSASYNTPRLVDKLASGIIISPSQSQFVEREYSSTSVNDRLSQLEAHLHRHLDSSSSRDADIKDILDIVDKYEGPKAADRGLRSTTALVVKPMKEGVTYFKNSIKQHEKKGGKGKKDRKFEYQALDKATNNKTQRIQDQLYSVEVIATTPKPDFVDLTGLQMVKQLFTGDGDDFIYSGDNENDMTIDAGAGDDVVHLDNRPKIIQTGSGDDEIIINREFIGHSYGVDGRTHWPVSNKSNNKEFRQAKSYIDGGPGTDTLVFAESIMEFIKEDYEQILFNKQSSLALGEALGDSTGELGDKFNAMLPTKDLKVDTFVEGVEWFEYNLPSEGFWKPQPLSKVARRSNESQLSFSTPALNGVSTGIPHLDNTFFLSDYKNAFNNVFNSNANISFSAKKAKSDLLIMGTSGPDKITGGTKNDVIVGGEGSNYIHSVRGNDIIYPGSNTDTIRVDDTTGHRFIVGITPADLIRDKLHLPSSTYHKNEDDLAIVFTSGRGSVTLVDYYDVKRHISDLSSQHPGIGQGSVASREKSLKVNSGFCMFSRCDHGFNQYKKFLRSNSFYRDVAGIDLYASQAELVQETVNSLGT